MKNDSLKLLFKTRENLNLLNIVNCRMIHESVLIDRHSQLPVAGMIPDIEFSRRGLCPAAKRNLNLSCSHSIARYSLVDALTVLEQISSNYSTWRSELNKVNQTIHRLDHEKGDAEKQAARIIQKISETAPAKIEALLREQVAINRQIAEIERQHDICAAKIENLKDKILAAVNLEIEEAGRKPE